MNTNNMEFHLVGSTTSPFVRRLRILMDFHQIPYQFEAINYMEAGGDKRLRSLGPVNKLPVLLVGDQKIFDSRIIFQFIRKTCHIENHFDINADNDLTILDAGLDSLVNLFSWKRGGVDFEKMHPEHFYYKRQVGRVLEVTQYFEERVQNLAEWNYVTMSLYAAYDWAQIRKMIELVPERNKNLLEFLSRHSVRPEVVKTQIPI